MKAAVFSGRCRYISLLMKGLLNNSLRSVTGINEVILIAL